MNENTDIGERLRARLLSGRQVTGLVDDRIYPSALPQKSALPAIVYSIVSTDDQHHLAGASGFAFSRVQFDCHAATSRQAGGVAKAVADLLDGFAGQLSDPADPNAFVVDVNDCSLDNDYERSDNPPAGSDERRYRRVIDFQVSHTKPTPTLTPQ